MILVELFCTSYIFCCCDVEVELKSLGLDVIPNSENESVRHCLAYYKPAIELFLYQRSALLYNILCYNSEMLLMINLYEIVLNITYLDHAG